MIADRKIGDWENLSIFGLFSGLGKVGIPIFHFCDAAFDGIKQFGFNPRPADVVGLVKGGRFNEPFWR